MVDACEFIAKNEGCRLKPYKCPAGKLTIGYGRNLEDKGISQGEARRLLENDVRETDSYLYRKYPWYANLLREPLEATIAAHVRRVAMIDMCFNLGPAGFAKFKRMIAAMTIKDYKSAAQHAKDSKWYKQVGRRGRAVVHMIETGEMYAAE